MLDLDTALGDVLSHAEPCVLPATTTAHAVVRLDRRGDLAIEELRRFAFTDPAIAAELLRAANEGRDGAPISSLPQAEAHLGSAAFVRIVREVGGAAQAPSTGPLAALRQRAWRGAVVSAILCRELARERGLPSEEAYACGLLHDVGRLAAFSTLERLAAGTRPGGFVSLWRWERLAERWHVQLGIAFAERHQLPRPIFEAIAFHHDGSGPANASPLLRVVRSVDALVAVLVDGTDSGAAVDGADLTEQEAGRLARAIERMQDHVATLEQDPGPGPAGDTSGAALPALREPRGEGVRLWLAGREYAAVGFAAHQLIVTGPAPLGEGALLEVEVLDRRRGPFHARVLTSWEDGERFGAILLPLGLSGPSLADLGGNLPAGMPA